MPDAPPSKKRPAWAAGTPVEPKKNESGSTTVLCWLVELVNGSVAIFRTGIDAPAARLSTSAAVAADARARAARLPAIAPPFSRESGGVLTPSLVLLQDARMSSEAGRRVVERDVERVGERRRLRDDHRPMRRPVARERRRDVVAHRRLLRRRREHVQERRSGELH